MSSIHEQLLAASAGLSQVEFHPQKQSILEQLLAANSGLPREHAQQSAAKQRRQRILQALSKEFKHVTDIAESVGLSRFAVYAHLHVLRDAGLVVTQEKIIKKNKVLYWKAK